MKTIMKINIEAEVEVIGKYIKPYYGSYEQPTELAEFEIQEVLWQGQDIAPLLDKENFDFNSLEQECLEQIENER
jgi:hypothetical protein